MSLVESYYESLEEYYDSERHPSKRQKTTDEEDEGDGDQSEQSGLEPGEHADDRYKTSPSLVVHVRGLCDGVVEGDLVESVERFGPISYVMMLPNKRQALVEFEDLDSSQSCVTYSKRRVINVSGFPAFFNFSTSQRITRPGGAEDPKNVNNVLFLAIQNPLYPITTDVLYTICNTCGPVLRIVIFKKNGVQAMVEFDTVQSAQKAKASLNGADIYSGCCTLKIEYAKPTRLNVFKNNSESWDYTNPNLTRGDEGRIFRQPALLGDHPSIYSGNGYGYPHSAGSSRSLERRMAPRSSSKSSVMHHYPPSPPHMAAQQHGSMRSSKVLMVYGLVPNKVNCDKIFNLLCLYGNVEKVKFMKSMPDAAMVEMGDEFSVERAITHLNNVHMFGKPLSLCVSKQHTIMPSQSYELQDGTNSYKDFTDSRNNRFSNPGQASKNRIQPPSSVLHFFNAPIGVTEETFQQMCEDTELKSFLTYKTFSGKSDRSLSGLLEWESKDEAVEALTMLNHYQIKNPSGPYPYTLKLCFSSISHV